MGYAPPEGSVIITPEMLNAATAAKPKNDGPAPGTSPTNAGAKMPDININVKQPGVSTTPTAVTQPVAPTTEPLTIGNLPAVDSKLADLQMENAKLRIFQSVGGEENFHKLNEWAVTGLEKTEKDALNAALAGNVDPSIRDYLLKLANDKFMAATTEMQQTRPLIQGQPGTIPASTVTGISAAEYNTQYLELRRAGKGPDSPEIRALDAQFQAGFAAGLR